ncbi:MAG: insulinase family protein [Rhodospirillales bacterium]|nr:insulinase family protein [Alphaproteobacteria bacterium]MCB9981900.1 insulinase family protein [Rhodospirillales bacterium]
MKTIQTTTLPNGLRIITDHVPSMHSVALGIWAGVGTRHENLAHNGVAHMVEHMLFKGTKERNALRIAEELENVGGSMNAYTGREVTSYHVHLLAEDTRLGLDVMCDMYLNSTLPEDEIEREREVILQEIGMCNDTPDDLVFDVFSETAYPEQALGAPILGRAHNIEAMNQDHLRGYIDRFYTPANTVVSAAGAVDHNAFVAQAEEAFADKAVSKACTYEAAAYKGGETRLNKDLEQSHFILGFQGLGRHEDDYYAAQALSTVLGSGMSSRLFQEVREKRGLVYSIFSYHSGYQDNGTFGIYAGTGPEKLNEIIPIVCDEVLKVGSDVNEEELARAKSQLKAGLLMGRESMMTRADQQAKCLLFRNKVFDLESLTGAIEKIDRAAIARVAEKIFSTKPTFAALGPLENLEAFEQIQERLAA